MSELALDNFQDETSLFYGLSLRGYSLNPMIDAATPLLGMVMRLKNIAVQTMPDNLYQQIVKDIQSIEQLLREKGYEQGMVVSFRYVLCTFIDEVALGHGWGTKSSWFQHSLLTYFHNETWGGEKVYILLDKLLAEPKRYIDLLEFIYICFSLGFRGRYKVENQNNDEFERIFSKLHDSISSIKGKKSSDIVLYQENDKHKHFYELINKATIKKILGFGLILLIIIYFAYSFSLSHQSQAILEQLNSLLN
ncbi:type IVB secretion system protein IcmH/DotU [Bisgaard Taxon 46]